MSDRGDTLEQSSRRFMAAVGRFRTWATAYPEEARGGEWECDYGDWQEIYSCWRTLLAAGPVDRWDRVLIGAALYAIACDNECEILASEVPRDALRFLTERALAGAESDAKWQLANELGGLPGAETEALLLRLVSDDDEYVRRRALASLARIDSDHVTAVALREWATAPADMPWTRMNALWALHRVSSPALPSTLAEALSSSNELLRDFARRVQSGDLEP